MRDKRDFVNKGYSNVRDGLSLCFWEDIWLGDTPHAQQYSSLYDIAQWKNFGCKCSITHTTQY
jgi:hypothetical protein